MGELQKQFYGCDCNSSFFAYFYIQGDLGILEHKNAGGEKIFSIVE